MKVSLISTVLNEERSIRRFLDGLLAQTRPADEILLADGGSTDGTLEVVEDYIRRGAPIRLIEAPGANIARGRNIAIGSAAGEVVAATDAGCRADPRWLAEITAPFEDPSVGVVCGFSVAEARNRKEESFGILTLDDIEKVDIRSFNPSSRSLAFRKTVWEEAGGYPEALYCAEDSFFNQRMRATGARFVFRPEALVHWYPHSTLRKTARQYFRYAQGDGRAGLYGRVYTIIGVKVALVLVLGAAGFAHPVFWGVLAASLFAYYLRMLQVNRRRGSTATNSLVFVFRLVLDGARLAGNLFGRWERRRRPEFRALRVEDSPQRR